MVEHTAISCRQTLLGILLLCLGLVVLRNFLHVLPTAFWWEAIWTPDLADVRQLLLHFSVLPRLVVSVLCGGALGLAGVIFQQVLRNPLASPSTLGVSAGASLALTVATSCAPGILSLDRESIALVGAALAMLIVFGIAWRQALSPLSVVLAGMVVSLYCGAAAAGIQLELNPYALSLYLWGAGSLSQDGWGTVFYLLPRLAAAGVATAFLIRPLTLLGLDDASARSLGVPLSGARLIALTVATALSAFVVSAVGVIGFIGLAAPVLVRLAGVRTVKDQAIWSPLLGAGLLCLTDQCVQWTFGGGREWIPTGAATALLGAPLLLWMLPRVAFAGERPHLDAVPHSRRVHTPWRLIGGATVVLAAIACISLSYGRGSQGWHWSSFNEVADLLRWRGPRLAAALSAGAMLAAAGVLLQRVTGNAMAAPETLGIGAGAAAGLITLAAFAPTADSTFRALACLVGALVTLMAILFLGRSSDYAPQRILLAGLAASALLEVLVMVFMVSGSPRAFLLRGWLAGSTDLVTPIQASAAVGALLVLLPPTLLCGRWLDILPLGDGQAQALGLELARSRLTILGLTALLTAAATLTVGPLGFVGLLGPHLARMIGLQRPLPHLLGASVLGALLMIVADWLGRTALFPYQFPAGLIATLLGGPYLVWLLGRRRA